MCEDISNSRKIVYEGIRNSRENMCEDIKNTLRRKRQSKQKHYTKTEIRDRDIQNADLAKTQANSGNPGR